MRCWPCWYIHILRYCASLAACLVSLYCAVAGLAGGAFVVVSLYSARNGQSAPRIGGRVAAGGVSARVGVFLVLVGRHIHPTPPPNRERKIWAAFPKNFFLKFYFFYFCICNRGLHEPVGVVSSFAGFFRVKGQKSSIFLMLEL